MNILWFSWAMDTLIIIIFIALSASVVRFISQFIFRFKVPMDLATVMVIATYTFISWACFYRYHVSLDKIFPWMAWFVLGGLLCQLIPLAVQKNYGFTFKQWTGWLESAISFFLFALFLICIYSYFICDNQLPIAIEMNNDIWVYSKYANIALSQPTGNNLIGFDYFQNDLVDQTPAAFMILAGFSLILNQPISNILTLCIILLMAYSAHLIKNICINYCHQKNYIGWLIALVWLSSPLISHLGLNYFLAQWLGITVFLTILSATLKRTRPLNIQLIMFSLLYYLLFMSYPGFYAPYLGLLLVAHIIDAWYFRKNSGEPFWSNGLISSALAIPIALSIAMLQNTIHFQKLIVAFQRLANEPYFMSERLLLNPMSFLSMPTLPSPLFHTAIGLSLVMLGLYLSLTHQFKRGVRLSVLALFSYLFFIAYPCYFFIYLSLLFLIKSVDLFLYKTKNHIEYFNPFFLDVFLMVPILFVVIYLIEPSQFMSAIYGLASPNFKMGISYGIDAGSPNSNFIGNIFLVTLVLFYIRKMQSTNSLSHEKLLLNCLFILNLCFYLCYYLWKGFSYQQWKLGTSIVQTLSFVPILAIFYLLREKLWFKQPIQAVLLACILLINLVQIYSTISYWSKDFEKYSPLKALTNLDNDSKVNRVVIDIQESIDVYPKTIRGMLMSMQFINKKPLEVYHWMSKLTKTNSFSSKGTVLITNHCFTHTKHITPLGKRFCMIKEPTERE